MIQQTILLVNLYKPINLRPMRSSKKIKTVHAIYLSKVCWELVKLTLSSQYTSARKINSLQVNWGGVVYLEFTKILVFRDFDDALKILLDMCIFSYYTHYSQNCHARPVTEGPMLGCNPPCPLNP